MPLTEQDRAWVQSLTPGEVSPYDRGRLRAMAGKWATPEDRALIEPLLDRTPKPPTSPAFERGAARAAEDTRKK